MTRYEDTLVLNDKVSNALKKINQNLNKLNVSSEKAKGKIEDLKRSFDRLSATGHKLTSWGRTMTFGLTLPIVGAGVAAAKAGMEFQDAEMRLQTMLGSAEKGSKLFKDIVEMGARTPFQAKDLLQASTLMLNFGISAEKVIPYMQQLGDISGGNAERFQSLALAFSQVASAGRLQGQDLLQLINAGFNPLQVISEKTGRSMADLKDDMSKGKISFEMLTEAMEIATGEGGRFNGMMEKMSKTASGKLSTLLDNFNTAMAKLGLVALPYVIKGIEFLTRVLEKFTNLSPKVQKLILVLGALTAAIPPLTAAFGLLLAHPIIATIAGITAGIITLINAIKTLIGWLQHLRRMKISNINLDNQDNLAYLANKQAEMGTRAFKKKYGGEVARTVTNYRQNNTNTSNKTINNNFYGNMTSTGNGQLDMILNGGMIPLGV